MLRQPSKLTLSNAGVAAEMPVVDQQSLELALQSIARHGDTDIFPLPIENHWFHDAPDGVVEILQSIDATFDEFVAEYPVVFAKELSGVGYSGFRAATQIDPVWNAYLLGLVLQLGHDIEAARAGRDRIFSYRYSPDPEQKTLFAPDLGWGALQREALTRAQSATYVLATDISDFYPRIYHHRLENALGRATQNKEAVRRIKVLLFRLAGETSYGLPVGGNAARLLAELVLNSSDRLLAARGVNFVRFVDDYYLFVESRQHAHAALVTLSASPPTLA